ncbi:MAG: diguanylate cyclase [Ruminiclostridium sp.]|nr:diguanylate cyclase [Ruminiclostridium sp.]
MATWIIVVDDDTTNLQMAGHILSRNKMRVTALKSGQALLDYISTHDSPDLILLDIKMPGLDGFETLKHLRRLENEMMRDEVPVIFITANEDTSTESHGFEVGVSDYIRKPFNPDVLLHRINNIVLKQEKLLSLRNEASTDPLTGFLNKAGAGAEMPKLCMTHTGCLMMIDLDSFKLVNDIHGHEMGDEVLKSFSRIISGAVPEGSRCARIGGDEFTAFCERMLTENEVKEFTARLNDELVADAKRLMGEDMDIPLGTSIGAVFIPRHGNDYNALLKLADKALYNVKRNGKHSAGIYRADIFADEETDSNELDINTISEILGERTIPNVALQLDKDAFSYVYRYIMRYIIRNRHTACKMLVTISPSDSISDADYKDLCDEVGTHLRESLRKTDILTRTRYNQYFIFLTDIPETAVDIVIKNVIGSWRKKYGSRVILTYETEFVGG